MVWNLSFPLLRLSQTTPTNQAIALFPEAYSTQFKAVPLRLERNTLLLATPVSQPEPLKKEIEVILHRPVRLYVCTWVDFVHYQARCYNHAEVIPERPDEEIIAGLQSGMAGTVARSRQSLIDKPGKNDILERNGLISYLPHLAWGELLPPKGLELLLPEAFPRDHFIPLGWVSGTLFCLIDDPQWAVVFSQLSEDLEYPCQFVLADTESVNRAYQHVILRGPSRLTRSNREIIETLIQNGRLRKDQGEAALELEHQQSGSGHSALLAAHTVTADGWLAAYASLLDVTPLCHEDLPEDFDQLLGLVKELLPGWVLRRFTLLPLVQENGTLLVGLSQIDLRVLDLLAALTHLKIEPRLMDAQEITFWLDRIYPADREPQGTPTLSFPVLLRELGYLSSMQSDEAGDWRQPGWLEALSEAGYLNDEDLAEALSLFCG